MGGWGGCPRAGVGSTEAIGKLASPGRQLGATVALFGVSVAVLGVKLVRGKSGLKSQKATQRLRGASAKG